MEIDKIISRFNADNLIPPEVIELIDNNKFRTDLVTYFRKNKHRAFSLALLELLVAMRRKPDVGMPAENLMLSCYLVGLHNQVKDCLKIWEAKYIDFDTYCGLDIQLVPFAGVDETIQFLSKQTTDEGRAALEYVTACSKAGDFDELGIYYSLQSMPWFV